MIGDSYWYTGIMLTPQEGGDWTVHLEFFDDGFCDQDSTQGRLTLRYVIPTDGLGRAIDVLLEDAKRLGFVANTGQRPPMVYIEGDGEWAGVPYPPDWRDIVNAQARRLGWRGYHHLEAT